jgi:chemotaxis protein CheD
MLAVDSSLAISAEETIAVGIGQLALTSDARTALVAYGLGSCVAIAAHDPQTGIAGMIHILLPEPAAGMAELSPARFAATGVPLLLREIEAAGGRRTRLRVVAAGGAQMLNALATAAVKGIGERNAAVARAMLEAEGIRLAAHDFGGTSGRTLGLVVATGKTWVRPAGQAPRSL